MSLARNTVKPLPAALAAAAVALALVACGREEDDLSNGKALFTERCGSCHMLARAGTQGQVGPSLDAAFRTALAAGEGRQTVEGIVHSQILHPRKSSQMPAGLVKGSDAKDVAAYVAFAAARSGEDEGALAQAGLAGAKTGEQIYTAAGCGACHTFGKAGSSGNIGPNLDELAAQAGKLTDLSAEEYTKESILNPDAFTVQGFQKGVMPSFEGRLDEKQVQELVKYLLGN
ncbi:MAG TPA: c-type cytochrome [Thermoleophilaceae bacterium]|nr:c-type cytochrome [Thermoleophilaceae bacterium]